MKNTLSLLVVAMFCSSLLSAQTFNYSYTVDEQTYSQQSSMVIDDDGSTVTAHTIREYTNSPVYDARVVKVDDTGNVLWSKQFGVPGEDDRVNGICKADGDGYLLFGGRDDIDLGYGCWVFRLDNAGNLMWTRWYSIPNANLYSEGFVGTRTFESAENYIIAGTTSLPRRLFVLKIDKDGNMHWANQYYRPALVNSKYDYVTSLVEDKNNNGYIFAGTEHDYYTTGFSTLDLFTIGIDINGNITRKYRKYDLDLGDNENNPHIIENLDKDGYMMAFGTRAGNLQNNTVSFISTMALDKYLNPIRANLYATDDSYENHANSIYADPHGFYDLGCFIYDNTVNPGVRNASFLRIDPDCNPVNYFRYNLDQDQTCTFMAQDFTATHENYVLKTDHIANGVWSIGLIRTELNGETDCAEDRPINIYDSDVSVWRQGYRRYDVAEPFDTHIEEWQNDPHPIHCEDLFFKDDTPAQFNLSGTTINDNSNTPIHQMESEFKVYPSLVDKQAGQVSLDYQAQMDAMITIMIYDTQGRLMSQTIQEVVNGLNKFSINENQLATGLNTIIILENNQTVGTSRVVKL